MQLPKKSLDDRKTVEPWPVSGHPKYHARMLVPYFIHVKVNSRKRLVLPIENFLFLVLARSSITLLLINVGDTDVTVRMHTFFIMMQISARKNKRDRRCD